MVIKRAFDEAFIDSTISIVSQVGIENTRTKDVAEYAGFSEATMYRRFQTKEILLRETFLYIDKRISDILTQSSLVRNPGSVSFELGIYVIWRKIYRYLIENKEETIFLIRYRYSSLYTNEVRNMRQAYNGSFEEAYKVIERYYGKAAYTYREFLVNYIFEMTMCFAEKIITGKVKDNDETESNVWMAVNSAVKSWTSVTESGNIKETLIEKKIVSD